MQLLPKNLRRKLPSLYAQERGYTFMDDILYDSHTSIPALQDILCLVKDEGFKFGTPKIKDEADLVIAKPMNSFAHLFNLWC